MFDSSVCLHVREIQSVDRFFLIVCSVTFGRLLLLCLRISRALGIGLSEALVVVLATKVIRMQGHRASRGM